MTDEVVATRRSRPASRPTPDPVGPSIGVSGGPSGTPVVHEVRTEEDLLVVRHAVRAATLECGFSLIDQTRVVTAASELARNTYIHGGGGTMSLERLNRHGRTGLLLVARDEGPGIEDVEQALEDGYTTGAGLGHGLGGARRLMHEFRIHTEPGVGTTVSAIRWTER
ncbi:ATP-binding protein [Streptomyces calidiresistens]|nr:anti-sigma regulatory factor [Streptomyces calidiresistens]